MGMNWTRTSYLFLVMIMISVGVTSAYAITISLNADPVNVQGTLVVGGDLDLRGTSPSDNDIIFFDEPFEGSEHLQWDDSQFRFEFTRGLAVDGTGTQVLMSVIDIVDTPVPGGQQLDVTYTFNLD